MLARNRRVTLVDLRTLPRSAVSDRMADAASAAAGAVKGVVPVKPQEIFVYRHGLELTVSGSYLDLLAYLSQLERSPTRLYWNALTLDASAHPVLVMKLGIYTLSLDRAWLNV
jgi:MSHA biogenesis protein MshJ